MKAIYGAKVKNDRIDSEKIAKLMQSGMFPQAYVYPRGKRSVRDLLRRRLYFAREPGRPVRAYSAFKSLGKSHVLNKPVQGYDSFSSPRG